MIEAEQRIKLLFQRGANTHEIVDLTGYSFDLVNRIIREIDEVFKEPVGVKTLAFPEANGNHAEEYRKSIRIVQKLVEEGFITDDLENWNAMVGIYEKQKRGLPKRFPDRLRLEVFLKSLRLAKTGDHSLLTKYMVAETLGPNLISDRFFENEQNFVGENSADNPEGLDVDRIGYYRSDEDGDKWRQPMGFGQYGGMVVDSPNEALHRQLARNIQVKTAPSKEKE
ncbi:MAG: hypothetical protein AAB521_00490 [Patescibacteria group bacterium]